MVIAPSSSSTSPLSSSSSSSSSSPFEGGDTFTSHNTHNTHPNLIDQALQIHRNLLVRTRLHHQPHPQQPQPHPQQPQQQQQQSASQSQPQQHPQPHHSSHSDGSGQGLASESRSVSGLASELGSGSGLGSGLGSASGLEGFVSKVSQDLVQHLALAHQWDAVVAVLDDVHSAMRHSRDNNNNNNNSQNNNSSSGSSSSSGMRSNATEHRQKRGLGQGPLLALLYTVALRNTAQQHNVTLSKGKGQAVRLMEHQRHHGVRPYWSCVRYALKGNISPHHHITTSPHHVRVTFTQI